MRKYKLTWLRDNTYMVVKENVYNSFIKGKTPVEYESPDTPIYEVNGEKVRIEPYYKKSGHKEK